MRTSHFRNRLRYVLDATGLTRKDLSLLCGLRHSYFGSIFRPQRLEMGSSRLTALAFATGISIDWLVKGEGLRPGKTAIQAAIEQARRDPGGLRRRIDEALGPNGEDVFSPPAGASPPPAPPRAKPLPRRRLSLQEARPS